MAVSKDVSGLSVPSSDISVAPRHSGVVRITHWLTTLSFVALVLSGIAILLAHPRLYWGETGVQGGPSLIDLPLPFVLELPIRGPGRYLHFLAAWIALFTGLIYVAKGLATGHFSKHLLPHKSELSWKHFRQVILDHLRLKRPSDQDALSYNLLQRITYLSVIFGLFPLAIWTGLAMSPAITSVVPAMATIFGGQQSARTIHFFVACLLVIFVVIHLAMICVAGFKSRVRSMITGTVKERV